MMGMKTFFLLLALLFATQQGFATTSSMEDSLHYQRASDLCRAFSSSNYFDRLKTPVRVAMMQTFEGLKSGIGVSQDTEDWVGSDGYRKALTECFGPYNDNRYLWDSLALFIIFSDARGQVIKHLGLSYAGLGVIRYLQSFSYLARIGTTVTAGTAGAAGYGVYQTGRKIADPDYAKSQVQDEIRTKQIPELDRDYRQIFADIQSRLQLEKSKPASEERTRKLLKLEGLMEKAKQDYQQQRAAYEQQLRS